MKKSMLLLEKIISLEKTQQEDSLKQLFMKVQENSKKKSIKKKAD